MHNDVKKNSIFPPVEIISAWFDDLNGIGKLAAVSLFSNYMILTCVTSIATTLFGEYLIKRFNLEEKYPYLNKIIKLRLKFQNFYLKSNIFFIICFCIGQIILNSAVLILILTYSR